MKILLSGPIEGHLVDFYNRVVPPYAPHWVVCAGDYGVHPDPHFMDRAAKRHAGRDFAQMYVGAVIPPVVPTLTIAGVHDDQQWLNRRVAAGNTEILANVHYLHQGNRTVIGWESAVRVTGIGRAYSEATYKEEPTKRSYRHYTRREIERACSSGPTDLFVCYESLDSPGIKNAIYATRPKLILTVTHPNSKVYTEIQGTRVVSLGRKEVHLATWKDGAFV
jgi:hypothetical protein